MKTVRLIYYGIRFYFTETEKCAIIKWTIFRVPGAKHWQLTACHRDCFMKNLFLSNFFENKTAQGRGPLGGFIGF